MICDRIRALREDKDLRQEEIAKILAISQTNYSKYELGKVNIPIEALIRIARFYNVDMNYICGLTNQNARFQKSNHKKYKRLKGEVALWAADSLKRKNSFKASA